MNIMWMKEWTHKWVQQWRNKYTKKKKTESEELVPTWPDSVGYIGCKPIAYGKCQATFKIFYCYCQMDGQTDRRMDDKWMHQSSYSQGHVAKILHKVLRKLLNTMYEIGYFFNVNFSPKSNGPMDNSDMYSGTIEYKAVYMLARLQDCSYNNFKNFHKVLLKCMKNGQFFNFKVSLKSSGSTNFPKCIVVMKNTTLDMFAR